MLILGWLMGSDSMNGARRQSLDPGRRLGSPHDPWRPAPIFDNRDEMNPP